MTTREIKKATGKAGNKEKERRHSLLAVSLIVIFQILGWICFSIGIPERVESKTFTVNSTLDETDKIAGDGVCSTASGHCTLRAAIQEANALAGSDVIKLPAGLYMLTRFGSSENACATGDLDITDFLTISGKGAKDTFINGGNLDRVFHIIGSISVTLTDMTIQNGLATDNGHGGKEEVCGGGILNESASTLILRGVTLSNNTAQGGVEFVGGGGVCNGGALEITKSTLSNNAAIEGGQIVVGGAIYSEALAPGVIINSTTISNNIAKGGADVRGGGICNFGPLQITKSTLSHNAAIDGSDKALGGAIYCGGNSVVDISSTSVSNNIASGPVFGSGGGIYNHVGVLEIEKSTISNNTASAGSSWGQGGGIANNGMLTIAQSTISNNKAMADEGHGGGILSATFQGQVVTITNSTISNNLGRGKITGLGGGICSFSGDVIITGSTLSYNAASGGMSLPGRNALGRGGGIYLKAGTLTAQTASKIVSNFSSDEGGGICYGDGGTGNVSADSRAEKNVPNNVWP